MALTYVLIHRIFTAAGATNLTLATFLILASAAPLGALFPGAPRASIDRRLAAACSRRVAKSVSKG